MPRTESRTAGDVIRGLLKSGRALVRRYAMLRDHPGAASLLESVARACDRIERLLPRVSDDALHVALRFEEALGDAGHLFEGYWRDVQWLSPVIHS